MILPDGTPVFISPLLRPHSVPVRQHQFFTWMAKLTKCGKVAHRAYHKRVQKKWNKRYGMKTVDQVIKTKDGIFVSEEGYKKLREAFLR